MGGCGMAKTVIIKNAVVELVSVGAFGLLAGGTLILLLTRGGSAGSDYATLLSGFGGAILGSGLSAWVSFVLAKRTSADVAERDLAAKLEQQKSYVIRLMVKASLVLSDLTSIKEAIDGSLSDANKRNLTGLPFWQRVLPIVGGSQIFDVDPMELTPLIAAKDTKLVQASVALFLQHRNLVEAVKRYGELRGKVKDITSGHLGSSDGVVTTGLTKAQMAELIPYEVELESLVTTIRSRLPSAIELAEKVTFGIGPAMRIFLGDNDMPSLVPDTERTKARHREAAGHIAQI